MHQVQVKIERTPVEPPPAAALQHQKQLLEEGAAEESAAEKWLRRGLVLIRWVVRAILIHAWASYLHDNSKRLASSCLSSSFTLLSLLLYASSLLYLRFARHALASVSLNKCLALFNLFWAVVLLLTGLAFSNSGAVVAAEDTYTLSMFFYPHTVIANLFTHLVLTRPLAARQRLSPFDAKEPSLKRPACSAIRCLFLQVFLLVLWILYPIARIHDSYDHYLKSPYVLTLFILSTLVCTVSFIVFFCTAIALVFFEHEEFPTLL